MCCVGCWGNGDNCSGAFLDSLGFAATTAAVAKAGPAFQERVTRVQQGRSCCSWLCCSLQSSSRSYFRDACFSTFALKWIKLAEVVFWVVTGVFAFVFCCGATEPFNLAKRSFVQWVANLVFSFVSFVGFCYPKWGVALYGLTLRRVAKLDPTMSSTLAGRIQQITDARDYTGEILFTFIPVPAIRRG